MTEPEHISRWFSDAVELDLRPGGRALLRWNGGGSVRGRVERVEAPHFFSFRWLMRPAEDVGEDNSTLVEFSLSAEGDGTRLTVVESGFADLPGPEDEKRERFDGHDRGWDLELGELVAYLGERTGTPTER